MTSLSKIERIQEAFPLSCSNTSNIQTPVVPKFEFSNISSDRLQKTFSQMKLWNIRLECRVWLHRSRETPAYTSGKNRCSQYLSLQWFQSYLTGRQQMVSINTKTSGFRHTDFGVPQGSVMGPLLFTIYMIPLSDRLKSCGVHFHSYADDTQIYVSCTPGNILSAKKQVENCLTEVANWMFQNCLKLNS